MPSRITLPPNTCVCGKLDCLIPYGLCHCGCGHQTKMADRSTSKARIFAGHPHQYVRGHGRRSNKGRQTVLPPKLPVGFYVYLYLRSKPTKRGPVGSPYYVGKGKLRRAWDRFNHDVSVPSSSRNIVIAVSGISETAAHAEEVRLIKQYGRIDKGTGCLRNKTDGGDGASGMVVSPEVREKIRLSNLGKVVTEDAKRKQSETKRKSFAIKQENQLTQYLDAFYARINGMKITPTFTATAQPAAQPQGRNRATWGGSQ